MDEKADPPPLGKVVGQYFPASRYQPLKMGLLIVLNILFIVVDIWILRQ